MCVILYTDNFHGHQSNATWISVTKTKITNYLHAPSIKMPKYTRCSLNESKVYDISDFFLCIIQVQKIQPTRKFNGFSDI